MTAFDMILFTVEMLITQDSRTTRPKSVCPAQMGIMKIRTFFFLELVILQDFTQLIQHITPT